MDVQPMIAGSPIESTESAIGSATRERILRAAERLFAERGFDAVSIRDITGEAEANKAAIHYHFGTKVDLVRAILRWRAADLGARRATALERIEGAERPTLRDVVRALVEPVTEMMDEVDGGEHHIGFIVAVAAKPEFMPEVMDAFGVHTERYVEVLARATPNLSPQVRELRIALAKDLVNRFVGQPDGPIRRWVGLRSPGADDHAVERLIDFLVGAFEAPDTTGGD